MYGDNPPANWLHSLFDLTLDECKNCERLHPLGNLSLEYLEIRGMSSVKKVGDEFLGTGSQQHRVGVIISLSFPNWQFSKFNNLAEWEDWEYETAKIMRRR